MLSHTARITNERMSLCASKGLVKSLLCLESHSSCHDKSFKHGRYFFAQVLISYITPGLREAKVVDVLPRRILLLKESKLQTIGFLV